MTSNDSAISFQVKVEKRADGARAEDFILCCLKAEARLLRDLNEFTAQCVALSPSLCWWESMELTTLCLFLSCDSSRSNIFIYLYSSIILTWLRQRFKSWSRDLGVAIHASEAGRCSLLQVSCRLWFTRWRRTNWGAEETKGALTAITAALFKGRL